MSSVQKEPIRRSRTKPMVCFVRQEGSMGKGAEKGRRDEAAEGERVKMADTCSREE
jgi:hypothetical protein